MAARRVVWEKKMEKKICNSNLPLHFSGRLGKKRKKKKAAAVSGSPSAVASGANGCDWPASAERPTCSAECAAAGECRKKRSSCLIIPPKCGAAGDTATRGLCNHFVCHLNSFCRFLFLGVFFLCQRITGKPRMDLWLSSETVDFFSQIVFLIDLIISFNCFLFFYRCKWLIIDISEFLFHLLTVTQRIWILFWKP